MSPEYPFGLFVELFRFEDSMLIHSAFLALLFDGRSESVAGRNIPIVAALKSPANKACQPMSASGLLGSGEIVVGTHGCTSTFVEYSTPHT
jgi:hypothetical protein